MNTSLFHVVPDFLNFIFISNFTNYYYFHFANIIFLNSEILKSCLKITNYVCVCILFTTFFGQLFRISDFILTIILNHYFYHYFFFNKFNLHFSILHNLFYLSISSPIKEKDKEKRIIMGYFTKNTGWVSCKTKANILKYSKSCLKKRIIHM